MEQENFEKLRFKTAFSCMACDGHIDQREVELIKNLHAEKELFGKVEIENELNRLVSEINTDGENFLRSIFNDLKRSNLSEEEELEVVRTAINIIRSDEELDYSEIKFFKIIRTKLDISNSSILQDMPEIEEYLEQDIITDSYIDRLKSDYFNENELPTFKEIKPLSEE